jgi:hypothetical protein
MLDRIEHDIEIFKSPYPKTQPLETFDISIFDSSFDPGSRLRGRWRTRRICPHRIDLGLPDAKVPGILKGCTKGPRAVPTMSVGSSSARTPPGSRV